MTPASRVQGPAERLWRAFLGLALGVLVAALGCERPATQIVVRVDSDLREGDELRAVHVRLQRVGADSPSLDHTYDLGSGEYHLPGTVGVVPGDPNDPRPLEVVVHAILPLGEAFDTRAIVSFQPEQTLLLDVYLAARCRDSHNRAGCDPDETCGPDGCEPIVRPPLPPYTADAARREVSREDASDEPSEDVLLCGPGLGCCEAGVICDDATVCTTAGACERCGPGEGCCEDGTRCPAEHVCGRAPPDGGLDAGEGPLTCVPCGGAGQACCADGACASGGRCAAGRCVRCGGLDQPCCEGSSCVGGARCTEGLCRCGAAGEPCCASTTPCASGTTCASGVCEACGASGQPCCRESACAAGTACAGGLCLPCGASGQPCCASGTPCAIGGACAGGLCLPCGAGGQPCCAGGMCAPEAVCSGGACQPCGATGQPCCTSGTVCAAGTVCSSGACAACGAAGQPCCASGTVCAAGTVCSSGRCAACGGSGQPCCTGGACGGGTVCAAGTCQPCGASGQPCCTGSVCGNGTTCSGGRCVACGGTGQPCCAGRCNADSNPCVTVSCASGTCQRAVRGDGYNAGSRLSQRCCGGALVDISTNPSHCGGCGTRCPTGVCEPLEAIPCGGVPGQSGRCRCTGANAQCPDGRASRQICRTVTPNNNRCAPENADDCASGTVFVDVSLCPNYCRY